MKNSIWKKKDMFMYMNVYIHVRLCVYLISLMQLCADPR